MIELYTYGTSNGQRASVMLEECALSYRAHKVDLTRGEQHSAAFLKINPAGQIPVIVDPQGPGHRPITVTQSGAIILYLADKSRRLLPPEGAERTIVLEAFMQVMTDLAPASSNIFYMARADLPDAVKVATDRLIDLLTKVDHRLGKTGFLAGDVSIADVALYPSIATRWQLIKESKGLTNLQRWFETMGLRPGVSRGMSVPG
jgi:GSH-dependent disulfide-bond oxidoreductase